MRCSYCLSRLLSAFVSLQPPFAASQALSARALLSRETLVSQQQLPFRASPSECRRCSVVASFVMPSLSSLSLVALTSGLILPLVAAVEEADLMVVVEERHS
jgi:hypothetical protein